ncbi:unnamed protein product [Cyclocybe aegerita]|uniref:WD40 repeat-like protein n=1 Tax=Cyclocybe aegerita TaxID=1973307 RepID=A0A8S0WAC0_CYCAE|nr:unnamed protein product [Cyclocybe aegerita]
MEGFWPLEETVYPRIYLWDFHQEDVKKPSFALRGIKGNIFSLAFSATNKYLLCAGTFERILKYDVGHIGTSVPSLAPAAVDQVFRDHSESIRAVTCHPTHDELFISASEDGTIRLHDCRQPNPSPQRLMQEVIETENEVTSVQYHPTVDNLFVTSDGWGAVCLRDTRMSFGAMLKRSGEGVVQTYNTKLAKAAAKYLSNPESSSVTFDRDGSRIAVTFTHYLPTIYSISDPNPIAVLSGQRLPDGTPLPPGQRGYSNSCTMKHGAFGGPGLDIDDMYAGGSDDFYAYIWKIPSVRQLQEQRKTISAHDWAVYDASSVAFTEGRLDTKILPVEISTPWCRLTGHDSIVNTIVFHPHFLHVVTAGVEKNVLLHSPTPSSPCTENLPLSPAEVRQLDDADAEEDRVSYLSALMGIGIRDGPSEDDSERRTLSLFDS